MTPIHLLLTIACFIGFLCMFATIFIIAVLLAEFLGKVFARVKRTKIIYYDTNDKLHDLLNEKEDLLLEIYDLKEELDDLKAQKNQLMFKELK